jgi:DNA-directed RNA polymerase subunit beta'
VLTGASLASAVDNLTGLKENVILGHLIPAGTAYKPYLEMRVKHLGEPIPETKVPLDDLAQQIGAAIEAADASGNGEQMAADGEEAVGETAAQAVTEDSSA